MAQKFLVVIPQEGGGIQVHQMKRWLQAHPEYVPPGMDAWKTNSHGLARGLVKAGWTREESATEVRLIFPGTSVQEQLGYAEEDESIEEAAETTFAMERDLQQFIGDNLAKIKVAGKHLTVYQGRTGIEFDTEVGRIDILAVDDAGAFYVFELKRGTSPDAAVGQIARYMGWISQGIGRGKPVYGIIVAREISPRLRFAVHAVPNLSLFEYKVSFTLNEVKAA